MNARCAASASARAASTASTAPSVSARAARRRSTSAAAFSAFARVEALARSYSAVALRVRAGRRVGLVRAAACVLDGGACGLEARGRVLGVRRDGVASRHGVVALRDELDPRGHALPAAGDADGADEVTGPGDHRRLRGGGEHGLQVDRVRVLVAVLVGALGGVRDQGVPQDRGEGGRALHHVDRSTDARGQPLRQVGGAVLRVRDDDVDAADVRGPGVRDRVERDGPVVGEDGVGEAVEGDRDGALEPGRHRQRIRETTDDARASGVDERLGTVADVDRHAERRDPGVEGVPLPLEGVQAVALLVAGCLRGLQLLTSRLERGGEGFVVDALGRIGAELGEGCGRTLGALAGLGEGSLSTLAVRHRGPALRPGDVDGVRESLRLEVVLRHACGLRGDAFVEGVERVTGVLHRAGGLGGAALHLVGAGSEPVGLGADTRRPAPG